MKPYKQKRKIIQSRGFTLIELLATVAIMAITLTVGVPGISSIITNSRLTASANTMVSALQRARSESIKRLKIAGITPKDGSNWKNGWVLWVGSNSSSNILQTFELSRNVDVTMSSDFAPSYRPDGRINGIAGSFTFSSDTDSRTVTIGNTGRVQVINPQKS